MRSADEKTSTKPSRRLLSAVLESLIAMSIATFGAAVLTGDEGYELWQIYLVAAFWLPLMACAVCAVCRLKNDSREP